jgi:hypothetical protein
MSRIQIPAATPGWIDEMGGCEEHPVMGGIEKINGGARNILLHA